jgi:hypothetical protein
LLIVVSVVYCLSVYGWLSFGLSSALLVIAGYWLLAFGYYVGWLVWLLLYCLFIVGLLLLVRFVTLCRLSLAVARCCCHCCLLPPAAAGCCRPSAAGFPFRVVAYCCASWLSVIIGCSLFCLAAGCFAVVVVNCWSSLVIVGLVCCCWLVVVVEEPFGYCFIAIVVVATAGFVCYCWSLSSSSSLVSAGFFAIVWLLPLPPLFCSFLVVCSLSLLGCCLSFRLPASLIGFIGCRVMSRFIRLPAGYCCWLWLVVVVGLFCWLFIVAVARCRRAASASLLLLHCCFVVGCFVALASLPSAVAVGFIGWFRFVIVVAVVAVAGWLFVFIHASVCLFHFGLFVCHGSVAGLLVWFLFLVIIVVVSVARLSRRWLSLVWCCWLFSSLARRLPVIGCHYAARLVWLLCWLLLVCLVVIGWLSVCWLLVGLLVTCSVCLLVGFIVVVGCHFACFACSSVSLLFGLSVLLRWFVWLVAWFCFGVAVVVCCCCCLNVVAQAHEKRYRTSIDNFLSR